MLALKSQVRSCKGKEVTFPSNKGIKRERSTLCQQRGSGGGSDRGFGPGDLWKGFFPCFFCDSPGKVKWHCTLGGCCVKERVVFRGFSHQICSVYKEKRFCSAASLPYATWSLSTQVFFLSFLCILSSRKDSACQISGLFVTPDRPLCLEGDKWLAVRILAHFPFAVFGLQANRIKNPKKSCFK